MKSHPLLIAGGIIIFNSHRQLWHFIYASKEILLLQMESVLGLNQNFLCLLWIIRNSKQRRGYIQILIFTHSIFQTISSQAGAGKMQRIMQLSPENKIKSCSTTHFYFKYSTRVTKKHVGWFCYFRAKVSKLWFNTLQTEFFATISRVDGLSNGNSLTKLDIWVKL